MNAQFWEEMWSKKDEETKKLFQKEALRNLNHLIDEKNEDQSFDQFVKTVETFMNTSLDESLEPVKVRDCSPLTNKRKTSKRARSISKKLSKVNLNLQTELGRDL